MVLALLEDAGPTSSQHPMLIDAWVAAFNRSQVQPSLRHAQRLGVLVDTHVDQLSPATARFLRFALGAPAARTPS
jgi:hypothetical protein